MASAAKKLSFSNRQEDARHWLCHRPYERKRKGNRGMTLPQPENRSLLVMWEVTQVFPGKPERQTWLPRTQVYVDKISASSCNKQLVHRRSPSPSSRHAHRRKRILDLG